MASIQCHRPVDQTCCNQGQQNPSLGQKVSEMATRVFKKEETHTTQVYTQTQTHSSSHGHAHSHGSHSGDGLAKTHTPCVDQTHGQHHQANGNGTNGTGTTCQGKTRRGGHKRRGLLQKIKDGISGHSDGSSSSESESDDENNKN